jgi:hypothetical protein
MPPGSPSSRRSNIEGLATRFRSTPRTFRRAHHGKAPNGGASILRLLSPFPSGTGCLAGTARRTPRDRIPPALRLDQRRLRLAPARAPPTRPMGRGPSSAAPITYVPGGHREMWVAPLRGRGIYFRAVPAFERCEPRCVAKPNRARQAATSSARRISNRSAESPLASRGAGSAVAMERLPRVPVRPEAPWCLATTQPVERRESSRPHPP